MKLALAQVFLRYLVGFAKLSMKVMQDSLSVKLVSLPMTVVDAASSYAEVQILKGRGS